MVYKRFNEEVSDDGEMLLVYSSSRDSDLFKYYFGRELKYGLNGGSAYGFATYAILSDPFSGLAEVGYSDAFRSSLYGDNCFEFKIPVEKVLFFEFEDYAKTKLGQNSAPQTFIREQIERFGIDISDEQIEELTPNEDEQFSSRSAQAFYRFMSRKYYQDDLGALVTPCAGFVYKGKNDGRTYVGWDAYQLIPNRFTNDLGKTWQECDKSTPEYKEYLASTGNERKTHDAFDGHKTPRKEAVYRLFQKFNSSDDTSNAMADGVFSNIVIHDDRTVDCQFKSNLPKIDHYNHYLKIKNSQKLIKALNALGYKFGTLNCGIKVGAEAVFNEHLFSEINPEMWPESCTGGLKIAAAALNKDELSHLPTNFGTDYVYVVNSRFDDGCLVGKDIHFDEKKPCYTENEEIYNKLKPLYGPIFDQVLPSKPEAPVKRTRKVDPVKAAEKERLEKERNAAIDKSWRDDVDAASMLTESMRGKHSLKHLYNNNGSTQMKPAEYLDFVEYLAKNGMTITPQNCDISEKIDGSSQFFGYDNEGFFWEKFRMKDKVRRPDELIIDGHPTKYYSFVKEVYDSEKFEDFCIDLMAELGASEVKVQLEVVLTAAGGFDDEVCKIVCVPYSKSMMPKDGMCFVIQIVADGQTVEGHESEVAAILNREDLAIQTPSNLEFEDINLTGIIENLYDELGDFDKVREVLASRKKEDRELKSVYIGAIQNSQREMQSAISSNFQTGKYGQYYEGLVLKFDDWTIKITSDKFKEFMALHNRG